jgi:hypothetical protein
VYNTVLINYPPTNSLFYAQEKLGFESMDALVADMVQDEPTKRPTMEQVAERFSRVRKDLTGSKLRLIVMKGR